MKILILGFAKIKYMPYLGEMLSCTSKDDDITLFYFDRDSEPDQKLNERITCVKYFKELSDFDSPLKKLAAFAGYKKVAKKLMAQEDYDFVISLHTWPAVLLYEEIKKDYKDRFILDYKDVTFEGRKWFKNRVEKLIELSKYTLISSKAFLKVLPKSDKYLISHNINASGARPTSGEKKASAANTSIKAETADQDQQTIIRIRFWGLMRHRKTDLAFVGALDGDERFELHFHGRDGGYIKDYIDEHGSKNIFIHGTYNADELDGIAKKTDLLLNHPDWTFQNSLALGNKLYDGAYHYVPQLGDVSAYMGQTIIKNGLGMCVDPEAENLADTLCDYIKNLDYEKFHSACDNFIECALKENEETRRILCRTISTGKKTEN